MAVVVAGVGKYLPERVVGNEEIVSIFAAHGLAQTSSGKPLTARGIEDLIGIRERHWAAPDQNTSDLAFLAGQAALEKAGITWNDLSIIRLGSSSPEAFFPNTACLTLHKATRPRIEAVDILAACTSGVAAMVDVKRALEDEPDYRYGLAIGAEVLASRMTDFTDVNSDLWGDGAGAVVLKKTGDSKAGIICSVLGSDSEKTHLTLSVGKGTRLGDDQARPNIYLVGYEVQRFIQQVIPWLIPETIAKANRILASRQESMITLDDIDLFAVHQANSKIFRGPANKLGIPLEKVPVNVDRYGNTSSAAALLVLCEAIEQGRVGPGSLVMLVTFGGGLNWASLLLRL